MTKEEYIKRFDKDYCVGWAAIDEHLEHHYPDDKPYIRDIYGGIENYPEDRKSYYQSLNKDPKLQVFPNQQYLYSVAHYKQDFKGKEFTHSIAYGGSNLFYDPEEAEVPISGFGYELTMRNYPFGKDYYLVNVLFMMLDRYCMMNQGLLYEYSCVPLSEPLHESDSDITAIILVPDPLLKSMDTPHGKVDFLQVVGITTAELEKLKHANLLKEAIKTLAAEIAKENPLFITHLERSSIKNLEAIV